MRAKKPIKAVKSRSPRQPIVVVKRNEINEAINQPIALNQNIKKIHFKNSPYRFQIKIAKLTSNYDLKTVELFNQIKEFS